MAQERIEIKFIAKGNVPLVKAIKELHKATLKLNRQLKTISKTNVAVAKTQSLVTQRVSSNTIAVNANSTAYTRLQSVISVYRNKMLLAAFATSLLIRPILKIVKLSGDLEEVMNKANVVFGENSEIVGEWAASLGASIGRAKSSLIEMASGLQDTFVPLGFTREAATQLSTSLTALAIDVGSFSNKLDADVIRDFQSAIVGNHETVRKYGIIITEALLEQEAFSLGITESQRALTAQEKVQARVSLITKGSADAIGDAKKTSDSYTNTIKRLGSTWKEMGEKVGDALKPFVKIIAIILGNKRVIRTFGLLLGGLAAAFSVVKVQAIMATVAIGGFKRALMRTGVGAFVVALGVLAERFLFVDESTKELADNFDNVNDIIEQNVKTIMEDIEVQKEHKLSVEDSKDALIRQYLALGNNSTAAEYSREIKRSLTEEERKLIDMIDERTLSLENSAKAQKLIQSGLKMTTEGQKDEIQSKIDVINKEKEFAKGLLISEVGLSAYNKIIEQAILEGKGFTISHRDMTNVLNEAIRTVVDGGIAVSEYTKLIKELELEETNLANIQTKMGKVADSKWQKRIANGHLSLTLAEQSQMLTIESNHLEAKKLANLISEEQYQLALFEIEEKRLAITEKAITNADKIDEGMMKLAGTMNTLGLGSVAQLSVSFGETYDKILEQTDGSSEDLQALWTEVTFGMASAAADAIAQYSQAESSIIQERASKQLQQLRSSRRFEKMTARQKKQAEKRITDDSNAKLKKQFQIQQAMNAASVVMDTSMAIMNVLGKPGGVAGIVLASFMGAMGAAQLAIINQQKAPTMAQGGLVGGLPHSQGGTMINAERGEFVMSRRAVETAGLETMNRINAGMGGGGSINITFSGNINSDEFIESEAIPKIREAIRRGADIGEV